MTNRSAMVLVLSLTAIALASCSSDDDPVQGVGSPVAGAAGHSSLAAGGAGKGGTNPANGGTTSSFAGAGGVATTASGAVAGSTSSPGAGGSTQTAPSGGATALAGASSSVAGSTGLAGGGAAGAATAGAAGFAGAAGSPAVSVESLCGAVCAAQSTLKDAESVDCSLGADCMSFCSAPSNDPDVPTSAKDVYLTMLKCEASSLTTADYFCSTSAPITSMRGPAPRVNAGKTSPCASEICAFACGASGAEMFVDMAVQVLCGCA